MARAYKAESGVRVVSANGLELALFDEGEGPMVLLQHGFPDTPHTFDDVVEPLVSAGYRVVRPFGRGITPSARPSGDAFSVQDLAKDVVGIIDALGEDDAIVVGHDWGAAAVWGAGHLAPERLRKLVAVAIPHPAAIRPSPAKAWGARHFVALRLPGAEDRFRTDDFAAVRTLYERWSPGFDWPEEEFEAVRNAYTAPGCLDAALGYYRCLGTWPFRGRVKVETLVLGGLTDGVATEDDFRRSAERVDAHCEVRMLPGGHFLHREHPEPFLAALLEFLGPAR